MRGRVLPGVKAAALSQMFHPEIIPPADFVSPDAEGSSRGDTEVTIRFWKFSCTARFYLWRGASAYNKLPTLVGFGSCFFFFFSFSEAQTIVARKGTFSPLAPFSDPC